MTPFLYDREQPVAGPSSRPYISPSSLPDRIRSTRVPSCPLGKQCPYDAVHPYAYSNLNESDQSSKKKSRRISKRQDQQTTSTSSGSAPSSSSYDPIFPVGASSTDSSAASAASPTSSISSAATDGSSILSGSSTSSISSSASSTISAKPGTSSSFSQPWKPSTKSTASHAPEETPYVPGIILPLILGGDADDEAVYSVEVAFGHGTQDDDTSDSKRMFARKPAGLDWNGGDPQTVNLQIDLGSSDLWVASVDCATSDCLSAPTLFNESQSLDANTDMTFQFHSGTVSGEAYWEQVQIGGFGIGYQVFLAADQVSNEDLGGGNFTGVLGLALPANSVILSKIAGSTSGAPDGATFLDNLFGGGASAPTQRLFSLSLERREDVRTASSFGIGTVSSSICPSPCTPDYLPIIAQASLGTVGYLHWRIPLVSITATTWSDIKDGTGATSQVITLGPSIVDSSRQSPLAVLDSGGVAILVGYRKYADAIYAAYGISASTDGYYRMPCTTQLALSFTFGSQTYAVHPLDMSWPDPQDPSQTTCIGAIQYSSSLGSTGDLILGSSFLKNVYSIYQYPDNNKATANTWQPTVGMVSLTNASVACQDFYAVRVQRQSLSSVSSSHGSGVDSDPSITTGGTTTSGAAAKGGHVLTTAGIAGIAVVGFFIFAAGAFCGWWFWLRRRHGKNGKVEYSDVALRRRSIGHRSENSSSSLRNKKHNAAQRQKSMVEGYSDYEDSWQSTTEGGDSIRLGFLPEVLEEDEHRNTRGAERVSRGSSMMEDVHEPGDDAGELIDITDPAEPSQPNSAYQTLPLAASQTHREPSPAAARTLPSAHQDDYQLDLEPPRYPSAYGFPAAPATSAARTASLSMSGPFPSPSRQSLMRPDASPMYDIRTSDYFAVNPASRGREGRRTSTASGREGSGPSPRRPSGGILEAPLREEPDAREQE